MKWEPGFTLLQIEVTNKESRKVRESPMGETEIRGGWPHNLMNTDRWPIMHHIQIFLSSILERVLKQLYLGSNNCIKVTNLGFLNIIFKQDEPRFLREGVGAREIWVWENKIVLLIRKALKKLLGVCQRKKLTMITSGTIWTIK